MVGYNPMRRRPGRRIGRRPVPTRKRRARIRIGTVFVRTVLAVAAGQGVVGFAQRRGVRGGDAGIVLAGEPLVLEAADLSSAAGAVVGGGEDGAWVREGADVRA